MAFDFPTHRSSGTNKWESSFWDGTSGSISYGATTSGLPVSGDLVLLWIVKDDDVAPDTPSDGGAAYTLVKGGNAGTAIYYTLYAKFADGTEGSSVSWTSDSEEGVAFLTVFSGGSVHKGAAISDTIEVGTEFVATGTTLTTYNITPSWSGGPTRWGVLAGWDSNSVLLTYGADYTESRRYRTSSTGAGAAGGAVMEAIGTEATSPSAGAFTIDDAEEFGMFRFAIRGVSYTLGILPSTPDPTLRDTTPPTATISSASLTIAKPDNTADGDLLVAVINFDAEGTSRTFSSTGWTYRGRVESSTPNIGVYFLTKVADNEPASWSFTVSGTGGSMAGEVHAIADGAWLDWFSGVSSESSSTTVDTGTLSGAKGLIFGSFAGGDFATNTWTVDGDLTEISDTARAYANLATGYRTESAFTDVGPYTGTSSASQGLRVGVAWAVGPKPGFTLDAHFKVTKTGYSVLPTHVGHSSNFDDATGSVSVSKPAGTQEGDLMVAFYSVIQNTPSSGYRFIGANPTGPGSWIWRSTTAAYHAETLVCFTHVATDDEPDTYYFYSDYEGTDGYEEYGNMVTIVVSRNTEWVDGNVAAGSSSGTDSTTPTLTSERGIFYAAHGSDVYAGSGATASHPEDWTEVSEQEAFYYNTSYHSQSVAYKIQPGLTDAVETATWSRSVSSRDMIFVAYGEATEGILVDAVIDGPPVGDSFTLDALISKPVTGSWRPIKELPNQTTGTYNFFGESVAISGDGKVVIVGNTSDDSGGTANNGRVWVFSGDGWDAVTTLVGDPNTDYAFGHRIEVTSDGSTIFVSDYYDSTAISNAGVVYKFDGVGWGTRTKLGPPVPQATGRFGYSMALSRDDSTLVVGEPGWDDAVPTSDVGRVYAFSGTDWATVTALDTSSPEAGAQMGLNAAVSSDGSIVVAGSYQKDSGGNQEGAIDIFYGSSWGSSVIRQEATPASTDNYGRSVGVLPNGDIVASYVGGWGRLGKVEVLDATDTWTTRTDVTDQVQQHPYSWSSFPTFDQMVRSSSTGLAIIGHEYWSANGSSSQGRAYIFDTTDDWKLVYELERPADIGTSDYFGFAVAISDDGNYAVVGARYYDEGGVLTNKRGRVWLYKYPLDFVLDCWIGMGGEFTLDAKFVGSYTVPFYADAVIIGTRTFEDEDGISLDATFINAFFLVDALILEPQFQIDAIIHKQWVYEGDGTGEVDGAGVTVDARWGPGGDFAVAAAIKHTQSSLIHYDDMSPDNASSWGSPDVGNDYTYYLRDGTPFTKTGGYGVFVASGNSSGSAAYFNDDSYHADKEVYLEWATSGRSAIRSSDHDFGLNDRAYLRYIAVNINSSGTPDIIQLWVDGANRGSWYLSGKWNASYPRVCLRYRVEGTVFKAKAWLIENSEPDWLITYDGSSHYSTEASRAYFKDGSGFWWDGPWTKRFDNITITSLVVPPILLDAYINEQVFAGDFTVDAQVGPWFTVGAFIQPSFTLDAELYYAYLIFGRTVLVRAYITPASAGSFSASAVIATGPFFYANAYVHGTTFSFTLDYVWTSPQFFVSAFIGTKVNHVDFLVLRAYVDDAPLTKTFSGDDGWPVDAHIDGADGTVELDAVIRGLTEASSFGLDATSSAVGEERGQFALDAIRSIVGDGRFLIASVTAQNAPLRLDAVLAGTWTLDAVLSHLSGSGTMTTDAWVKGIFRAPIDAVIADGAGDYRGGHLDAVIFGSAYDARLHFIEVLAKIVGSFDKTFAVDAMFNQAFTLDARIWQPIFVDAYIESDQYIVYPPSQEGDTGTSTDGSTFSDPDVSFSPGDVGTTITIEGVDYVIATVVDENTVTVAGGGLPFGEGDLEWYIPSGNPTDPLGNPPLTTRISRILIEWSRPDSERWTDLTGDVLPAGASFTQSARVGPGTFEMTLKGAHPEFVGGEEIRVSVDGFRVFGGYVSEVERGYAFEDDSGQPLVFLSGADYNVLLDRLLIYNAEWDGKREGSGPYRTWKPFAKGTLDSTIIRTVADRFMSDPGRMGLDMTTYVDTIETPAPTTGFQMESGMTLRNLLTEISRITEGVWYVDAYKDLHYHDRSTVTAPFPITDGDGGIACRGLKISSTISVVANDVFVWGTQAFLDTGDSDIIYSRQTADQDWDVDWWTDKIAAVQAKIDAIRETPYDERTLKQRARLEALRKSKVVYGRYLAKAQASTEEGSVARFGRWQHAEFRQDIYQQSKVDRRAKAVMQRYSEPVVKGAATVFDPGFGAGQVAEVVSVRHGVADELPIRQMTIDFATAKEPVGDEYHAVPRYSLTLGLDPEEPWDIYQFLPFPDLPDWNVHFNIPTIKKPVVTDVPLYLDTFERMWASDEDFGTATNERDETRDWGPA